MLCRFLWPRIVDSPDFESLRGAQLMVPQRRGEANCSTTPSLCQTALGNIKSRLIDEFIPAAAVSSDLQIRTQTGGQATDRAAEVPKTDIGPEEGVDGPRWTHDTAET
ncbi:hypothetical protein THAOC_33991 [Thalassiosira oceanica]|uniref:Uncharacterized protein n=1 Tax=Thalassiosira oceanica TaxID=159749 RepID=K0R383_THAOC|nr:hypothetical protein THAOC_33991 [Thalassiosira oceanica]|eukprot:EJK47298.1 hypothetical protein THAOC_33991 [Thalassiosira oceanica]